MQTGMMWFDNDSKTTLTVKIVRAADYYRKKYGRVPDVCLVNPKEQPPSGSPQIAGERNLGGEMKVGRITVKAFRSVLPGHLWIGCEEKIRPNPHPALPQIAGERNLGEETATGEKS